ncbi:hypothetical protein [Streptomyces sp. NPDC050264]|uniref:hypothetical protein n=1 Tax=Streptomyces sp. NPDC050264 TaxID=3155038 RepID=UPI00342D34E0
MSVLVAVPGMPTVFSPGRSVQSEGWASAYVSPSRYSGGTETGRFFSKAVKVEVTESSSGWFEPWISHVAIWTLRFHQTADQLPPVFGYQGPHSERDGPPARVALAALESWIQ